VGLLAGENDMDLLGQTGVGRDINRHYYDRDAVLAALQAPVVRNLCALLRLRNTHPAFAGEFSLEDSGNAELVMRWRNGADFAELAIDFDAHRHGFVVSAAGRRQALDLLALAETAVPRRARTAP
jgi:sucrose phosphorylase